MNANLQRFLGGSPGAVLVKLIFLSLLVGAFMALIGITPVGLFERILRMLRDVFDLGFESIREVGRWLLYGAMVVVPLWLAIPPLRPPAVSHVPRKRPYRALFEMPVLRSGVVRQAERDIARLHRTRLVGHDRHEDIKRLRPFRPLGGEMGQVVDRFGIRAQPVPVDELGEVCIDQAAVTE